MGVGGNMDEKLINLQIGALLHDIGKIVRRAGKSNKKHSIAGADYLEKEELLDIEKYKEIYDMIKYHHSEEINEKLKQNDKLDDSSLAYLVYEADNIASGVDRVKYDDEICDEGDKKQVKKNEGLPLNSIFNKLNVQKNNIEKNFKSLKYDRLSFNIPKKKIDEKKIEKEQYLDNVLKQLKEDLEEMKEKDLLTPEKLNSVLEESCVYFPSSSYVDYPDVPYYDHVKLTAAVAVCMYLYDMEKENNRDYKNKYFKKSQKKEREKTKFLFVSGEFTGIQNFIYTITSKMAMKSLRGRSFYLELFIEHIIDEILEALDLSRVNLIYSAGSQFYMLLPNVPKTIEILENYKKIVNDFLLKELGTSVYYEISHTETSAEELGNKLSENIKKENKIKEIFKRNSIETSRKKLNRYSEKQLEEIFDEDSDLNKIYNDTKECVICKKSEKEEILIKNSQNESNGNIEICDSCKNYIKLGRDISKSFHQKRTFFMEKNCEEKSSKLKFPKYPKGSVEIVFRNFETVEEVEKESDKFYRFYSINDDYFGKGNSRNIKIGNYNIKSTNEEKENSLVEFTELVKKGKGIERLAVLRADIDNLGTLFQTGFEDRGFVNIDGEKEPYKFVRFSKTVVLSRYLSDFFKRVINLILERKNLTDEKNELFKEYCNIITERTKEKTDGRNIVLVYSGGDDVFAIGTWNDIIEFSVDLRTAFKEFSSDRVTLSAGIGFFDENYPIFQMAQKTGELEKLAKSYNENEIGKTAKDAIALFGVEKNDKLNHVYKWDDFIGKVLNEKYKYLKSRISLKENEETEKVFVGKSKWYSLMNLIRSQFEEKEDEKYRIDIARFAYIIARIKYDKQNERQEKNYLDLKKQLFEWIKNEEDAKQLLTAINILIYEYRDRKKDEESK
jgi:CRISPR-associated protein, csm1 family